MKKQALFVTLFLIFSGCARQYFTCQDCYRKCPPVIIDSTFTITDTVRIEGHQAEVIFPFTHYIFNDSLVTVYEDDTVKISAQVIDQQSQMKIVAEMKAVNKPVVIPDTTKFLQSLRSMKNEQAYLSDVIENLTREKMQILEERQDELKSMQFKYMFFVIAGMLAGGLLESIFAPVRFFVNFISRKL